LELVEQLAALGLLSLHLLNIRTDLEELIRPTNIKRGFVQPVLEQKLRDPGIDDVITTLNVLLVLKSLRRVY
jgi:hypothetical protein